jgi:hypothetical protein
LLWAFVEKSSSRDDDHKERVSVQVKSLRTYGCRVIRVERGAELFSKWPYFQESQKDWKAPRAAIETLTRYFRYCANLTRLNQPAIQVGCIIKNADLLVPALQGGLDYDLNALASLTRDWSMTVCYPVTRSRHFFLPKT